MQAWSRQPTQCIFCAHRQSRATLRPLRQIRELSRTAVAREENAQKNRPKKGARERDGDYTFSMKPRLNAPLRARWVGSDGPNEEYRGPGRKEGMRDADQDNDD